MNDMCLSLAQLTKPVEIVGVACGEGARNKGCGAGPDAVRAGGLVSRLQMRGLSAAWHETIRPAHAGSDDTLPAVETVCRRLAQRAAELGDYVLKELRALRSPLIREVRGRGLLIGVEFNPALASARSVCDRLLQHGVVTKDTHHTVVRFAPPLIITREQIDEALTALRATLAEFEANVRHAA